MSKNKLIKQNSDMVIHPLKGWPFGGRSFAVNKRLLILRYEFINRHLATLTCDNNGNKISIKACYLPFDNGTQLNLSEFHSCLQVALELSIKQLLLKIKKNRQMIYQIYVQSQYQILLLKYLKELQRLKFHNLELLITINLDTKIKFENWVNCVLIYI